MIFSAQDLLHLGERFNARYYEARAARFFAVKAKDSGEQVWVQTLLHNDSKSYHYAVEAFIIKDKAKHPRAQAFFLLAYLDSYWDEYFAEDENVYLPIDWTRHLYQEEEFYLKGQVLNIQAEVLADKLLGEDSGKRL